MVVKKWCKGINKNGYLKKKTESKKKKLKMEKNCLAQHEATVLFHLICNLSKKYNQ